MASLIVSKFDPKILKGSVLNCPLKFAMHDTMRWFMCKLSLPNLVFLTSEVGIIGIFCVNSKGNKLELVANQMNLNTNNSLCY